MAKITQNIRNVARQGNLFPATILDSGGGKSTVRLSSNGAIYRMLTLVGGPVVNGQNVHVDFSTNPPLVYATGVESVMTVRVGTAGGAAASAGTGTTPGGSTGSETGIILVSTGGARTSYEFSSSGFDSALGAAASGYIILLPPGTIEADHSIPAGVSVIGDSRLSCILTGKITLDCDNSGIENLTIQRTANDWLDFYGVVANGSGTGRIVNTRIFVSQAGSGDAIAVYMNSGATIECWNCDLEGNSGTGNGYAAYCDLGIINIYGGRAIGSTAPFN